MLRNRSWESMKTVLVVLLVAKGNQTLVAAAVVPVEAKGLYSRCFRLLQDALQFFGQIVLAVLLVALLPFEEARRRELAGVTYYEELVPARNSANCVVRRHLRRLVKHDHIELRKVRANELGHRQRTHEDARFVFGKRVGTLLEDTPDRLSPTLREPLEQPSFRAGRRALSRRRSWHPAGDPSEGLLSGQVSNLSFVFPELSNFQVMPLPDETDQRGD